MKVWNKAEVKALHEKTGMKELDIPADVYLTRSANCYIKEQGITMLHKTQKPEHMTHLFGTALVPKNHPRIRLRGKLDSFQARLLEAQVTAVRTENPRLYTHLQQVLDYSREILVAEVTEKPLREVTLLGLDEKELRYMSQHPKEHFGVEHVAPTAEMGEICVMLNSLRAQSREVELAAIDAFCTEKQNVGGRTEQVVEREDLLRALNRLSSGLYILFCKELAQHSGKGRS